MTATLSVLLVIEGGTLQPVKWTRAREAKKSTTNHVPTWKTKVELKGYLIEVQGCTGVGELDKGWQEPKF